MLKKCDLPVNTYKNIRQSYEDSIEHVSQVLYPSSLLDQNPELGYFKESTIMDLTILFRFFTRKILGSINQQNDLIRKYDHIPIFKEFIRIGELYQEELKTINLEIFTQLYENTATQIINPYFDFIYLYNLYNLFIFFKNPIRIRHDNFEIQNVIDAYKNNPTFKEFIRVGEIYQNSLN